jgi:2-dehydropantoate 2-reductase
MKVCIFGAGAVGGHYAVRLLSAGVADVSLVARGTTLMAIRSRGLTLRSGGQDISVKPPVATDDPSSLPPQDIVLVTLKATAGLPAAAPAISRLLAPGGCAVFMLNGIPWWWRHGLGGNAVSLPLLDPDGALWNEVRPERALGCVIYSPNDMPEPGVIVHTGANQLVLGEPDGSTSQRLETVVQMFNASGVEAVLSNDLRRDIWRKLTQNASGNAVAALSRADQGGIAADQDLRGVAVGIMNEILAVGAAQGRDLRGDFDTVAVAQRGRPGQRPSMLQSVLSVRPLEVEAMLGQVHAFAREANVPVPTIDVVLPLLRGLDRWIHSERSRS